MCNCIQSTNCVRLTKKSGVCFFGLDPHSIIYPMYVVDVVDMVDVGVIDAMWENNKGLDS